jgi:hypothetical protein
MSLVWVAGLPNMGKMSSKRMPGEGKLGNWRRAAFKCALRLGSWAVVAEEVVVIPCEEALSVEVAVAPDDSGSEWRSVCLGATSVGSGAVCEGRAEVVWVGVWVDDDAGSVAVSRAMFAEAAVAGVEDIVKREERREGGWRKVCI